MITSIGTPPWTRDSIRARLDEFCAVYERRPIQDNAGGMRAPHMFAAWFILQSLRPKMVIESGVWHGGGTWLIEQACPEAEIACLDINLANVRYRSKRARYIGHDFAAVDWRGTPKAETVLFFDDHQSALDRCKQAKWLGFQHIIFEDNYPAGRGDVYSLKKILACAGNYPEILLFQRFLAIIRGRWIPLKPNTAPNEVNAYDLRANLDVYEEFPPVMSVETTRWGDLWDAYETPKPLLDRIERPCHKIFLDEAHHYNWMCYVKLKFG